MNYQRQIQVIGKKTHDKLNKSTAVIVGVGGIGSVAAELLARAGVN
ncbi:MAG: ThiF family adenylyltransferase, partial [Candidatus Pacearchaeota archaeon]